jgi:ribosomal protein S27E
MKNEAKYQVKCPNCHKTTIVIGYADLEPQIYCCGKIGIVRAKAKGKRNEKSKTTD